MTAWMYRNLTTLFYGQSYIAAPRELSISFLLDKKSNVVPGGSGGARSAGRDATPPFFAPSFLTFSVTNADAMKKSH